jgi:hypothetical protein
VAIPRFLCGSPHLCRLRIDGLAPRASIECTDHMLVFIDPVSQVACHHQMFGFTLFALLTGRVEKQGETHELLSRAGDCIGSTCFLGAEDLSISVDDYTKGYHVCRLPTGSVCVAYMDWCGKHTCHANWVFPYRVDIDSNHCDSRI